MELIDIKFDQVIEWLSNRKKLDKDWSSKLRAIHAKQNDLIKSLSENPELENTIDNSKHGYLQAVEIFQKLLNTSEADKGKTLLGNYSSPYIYEWDRLIKLYQKQNLHLADCGKNLIQIGSYESPALKTQLHTFEKQAQDYIHKEENIKDHMEKNHKQFQELCKKMGITGKKIPEELKALTRNLPDIYLDIINKLKGPLFSSLLESYREISMRNHNSEISLPTIDSLRSYEPDVNMEELRDSYSPVVAIEDNIAEEIVIEAPAEIEWKIETIEIGEEITKEIKDFPLSQRNIRMSLLTELIELESFAEITGRYQDTVKEIMKEFRSAQDLVLMHEQPKAVERNAQKLEMFNNNKLQDQLNNIRKNAENLRITAKQTHHQLKEHLTKAAKFILVLETEITKLFPSISVKIVGEIIKDIKNQL
ncbi:unnamed protein product [Blepharisma stoltei]|uniref:CDK5RAP3-like protein n=1 Tax=Blepharisma stoltei TaxID=1481888 RepID=A0AAU9JAK6_9CILI|nr:unnamed protein product [Blepharisma stoltei]